MAITFRKEKPLSEIRKEEEAERFELDSLGAELAQEKIKGIQKDALISNLGQEITKLKLDVMQIKGGN